jgi:hypothetical protein
VGGYALLQHNNGETYLNSPPGRTINLRNNNANIAQVTNKGLHMMPKKPIFFKDMFISNSFQDEHIDIGRTSTGCATHILRASDNKFLGMNRCDGNKHAKL